MKHEKKRRAKRHRCTIKVDYYVYSSTLTRGTTQLKDVSAGGLRLVMKKAPFPETVIVIRGEQKRLSKYIDFESILLDTDGNPIVRVVHVQEDKKKKVFYVGVRFLERPAVDCNGAVFEPEDGVY
jgi:c-di-GMP-binding flagellar brake protein YcgR